MTDIISRQIDRSIGYAVRDITTPASQLVCWRDDVDVSQILAVADREGYSYLPVRKNDVIHGILSIESLRAGDTTVQPLTSEWLIAADTPILHLLELFAEEPTRHFFVLSSSKIIGLVSPADLNRVPARASFYLLVAHFETLLTELVRNFVGVTAEDLGDYLSENRLGIAKEVREEEREKDLELPIIHYVQLFDLVTIVAKHVRLRQKLGFDSRASAENTIKFSEVRNPVAHLNNLLIVSKDDIMDVDDECHNIIKYSKAIVRLLSD